MYVRTVDFARYSSIKIGQRVDVLVLEHGDTIPRNRYLIGGANNILISPAPPPLMMLGKDFNYIKREGDMLEIGAATPTGRMVSYAKKHRIGGFEFCAKLPGTLGGMLAMNAGVKSYEVFNILASVNIEGEWIDASAITHGYRFADLPGIAFAARFYIDTAFDETLLRELLALRQNQPSEPSAGSFFKNPPGDYAGRLIEAVGLKGAQIGGMAWSDVHANFLVNKGGGTFDDAFLLIKEAKARVRRTFGISLEEEVKIL